MNPPETRPSGYDAPTPDRFYIHDDLSQQVRARFGEGSQAFRLTRSLFDLVQSDSDRVTVLKVEDQIDALVSSGEHTSFAMAVGIGRAGERVARQLHAKVGWFPAIHRVDVTRVEDGHGGYDLASTSSVPLKAQLQGLEEASSVAVVDDTVFSGLTMRSVLSALPKGVLERAHAFCLRCVADTLASIEELCPVSAGFEAPGRILEDVSFINASGLVTRVGIRSAGGPPMAFFERPEWLRAWFPKSADAVRELCVRLNAILEPNAATD